MKGFQRYCIFPGSSLSSPIVDIGNSKFIYKYVNTVYAYTKYCNFDPNFAIIYIIVPTIKPIPKVYKFTLRLG